MLLTRQVMHSPVFLLFGVVLFGIWLGSLRLANPQNLWTSFKPDFPKSSGEGCRYVEKDDTVKTHGHDTVEQCSEGRDGRGERSL